MTNHDLTEREMSMLRLSATGWSAQEIADWHHITLAAAKTALRAMRLKLDARNITHAVHLAHKRGLLTGGES